MDVTPVAAGLTTGLVPIVQAFFGAMTTLGVLYLGIKKMQEETRQKEIALKVEEVKVAAMAAASKVEEVKLAAQETALRVEEVRKETHRTTTRVKEVKDVLDVTAQANTDTLEKISQLSSDSIKISTEALRRGNGALGRVLLHSAKMARRMADAIPDPVNIAAAELAEKDYADHQAEQTSDPLA